MAGQALDTIPAELRQHLQGVVIEIAEFVDADVIADMGLSSRLDLLGLYQGVSLRDKSTYDSGGLPDKITLYRQPILMYAHHYGERVDDVVRHVMIHEAGHHFGFSDEDMERIEGS